ncbi:MAG TPA: CDP-glucose 4,6-dehydratase [Terracidiphilus sp.]|nr:CDP-glucose 4,6-dehydratase [Terracidiphilus sp.]
MEDVVNPWKKRRVFLTGHTGFKGGWLALWLAEKGAVVRGYALAPETEPNLFEAANVGGAVEDVCADIRDFAEVHARMTEFAPEVVFHMAAQPLVRRSYADPLGTYATNVMGTAHVLDAARSCPSVRAVVCVTTDKCYENREQQRPYRETDPLGGHDPYASSKACAEMVASAYRSSFFAADGQGKPGVALATARAGNVIGGGDWSEDRLIPDLVRGFCAGEPVKIRRPGAVRPWQHVLEPLHGYMLLAERLLGGDTQFAGPYNFGPAEEDAWTVERVADRMVELWGKGAHWTRDAEAGVHEAHLLRLDASKARADLGWRPRLPLSTALEWTVRWYRAWQKGTAMRGETLKQIAGYERLGG